MISTHSITNRTGAEHFGCAHFIGLEAGYVRTISTAGLLSSDYQKSEYRRAEYSRMNPVNLQERLVVLRVAPPALASIN